jgi:protease I
MAGETLQGMKVAILVTEAVVDGNLVTSRKPDDIPAFTREMIKLFAAARGRRQAA